LLVSYYNEMLIGLAPPLPEIWTLKEYAQGRSGYPNAFLAVPQ